MTDVRLRPPQRMSWLQVAFIASISSVFAVLGLWTADRAPITEAIKVEAITGEVQPGEFLHVRYILRRYRACSREVDRVMTDGGGIRHRLGSQTNPVNGPLGVDDYIQPVLVPSAALPGPAVYRVEIRDVCNPVHRIWPIRSFREVSFRIGVPPKPGDPVPSLP